MRELFVVGDESTKTSLVLRTQTDNDNAEAEEFFLDISQLDDQVRAFFVPSPLSAVADSPAELAAEEEAPKETPAAATVRPLGTARTSTERLSMRPSEIQNRIRAGASVAELAAEMDVPESRVEPFAHPVLLERARIAELAKQAHPVREDGPAKLTIFEVLATAFAARGHSLSEATWDAYRSKGEPWTIRVSWTAGLSQNEAEWTLKQSMGSADTLVARNTVAADLTDPDFVQPVRSLSSVGRGRTRHIEAIDSREDRDELEAQEEAQAAPSNVRPLALDFTEPTVEPGASSDAAAATEDLEPAAGHEEPAEEEDFFQNPDPQPKPAKRRRKAVTPHWEDVLLGVRANTKRPRD